MWSLEQVRLETLFNSLNKSLAYLPANPVIIDQLIMQRNGWVTLKMQNW